MIHETFDANTEAIISPESFYGIHDKICDTCIITFSKTVFESISSWFQCTRIATMRCTNGDFPIYKLTYKGKEIAFYMSMVTSTGAGTCVEEARCLIGATKYIMFGTCGTLDKDITAGKLIVPTEAYRDEGLSYHYAPASDYIKIKNAGIVADAFAKLGLPYVMGKTWTIDGFFRETRGNMEKRKSEGCIAVEMECAGVQAVCDFRGLELYTFLFSGDLLDAPEWDKRLLGGEEELDHQLKKFFIALELALMI